MTVRPRRRMRLRTTTPPPPRLLWVDTPRPDCHGCDGTGWIEVGYLTSGGDGDVDHHPCHCHTPRSITLLALPHFLDRYRRRRTARRAGWASNEPPF
ncbi:hypothetical protein GCM10027160_24060 [Streptomyces calidiresistens]